MKVKEYSGIIITVLILVVIDQLIKFVTAGYLGSTTLTIINSILDITYVENPRNSLWDRSWRKNSDNTGEYNYNYTYYQFCYIQKRPIGYAYTGKLMFNTGRRLGKCNRQGV